MKKFRKGKILVIAILMIITSFFAFTGKASAYWKASSTSYANNKNSINKYDCKNSPKIHLIVRGREIEPEDILFDGNEPNYREVVHSYSHSVNPTLCDSYFLPDYDTVTNVHKLTDKINYVEHKYTPIWNVDGYGIIAWYDNPEFEGEPVKSVYLSRRNDYSNEDRYYYAKTGKIIDIYYNGIKRQVVVGKSYSPIYLDLEYDAIAGTYSNAEYNVGFSQYTEDIPYDVSVKAKIAYYSDDNYFTKYGNKYFRNVAYTQHESRIKLETGSHIYIDSTDSLPFIDVDSMRYDSFKEGTQKYTQANIIDVDTGEHADMSELHVTEHEPIKVTFELPNYHEYLGALDQNGNEYPAVIEMKQEYEGKVFTPVIGSDEVCTDYTVEYPPHAGLPGYYGYDNIHRLGVQLLTDFDNRYMPTLLSTTPETTLKEGYTISHISSCTPYDVYTKVHLYIDPSLLPDYAIVLNNKEITRVTRNTVYKLPEEAETKPAEVFTVNLKYQDGTTADETLAYTKTYTPTGFVIDGVHYDFGEEILVTRNLYIETDYEEEITGPELPSPTRNKYTFKGWFDMTIGGYRVLEIKDKTYKTLYAQWADKDYVIVTRPDGISIELEKGSEYIIPEVPEKEDEAYSRVKFVYNDGTERSEVAQGIKRYEKNGIVCKETGQHYDVGQKIIVNENMTLQGNYIENYYGVKFPADPEWTDHTFLGWFDQIEDGFRYTMYSGRKDITLYAQWTNDTEDVTIYYADGNNYSPFAPYTDRVKRGDPYKLLNGYYRINNSLATFIYQDGTTPDYVTHFSSDAWPARWIIDGKYYDMGETIIADSDKVIHADFVKTYNPVEFPEDPVRVEYTFLGWFDDPVNGTKYTKVDNRDNDIKLYAHWQRQDEEYTLPEIPAKNPENVATVTLKFQDNLTKDKQKYVKKNFTAVDYTVNGGEYNNEHFNVGDTINLTDDVTITPNYDETIVPVELYSATRDGYFFTGWYDTAEEEGGTKYTTYSGTSDITLYARWTTEIISTLCKRATTLHTDSKGVPYGNIPEAGVLKVGDAFDCDVNGDGVYDAETERFYYVNDFYDVDTGEYDHNIAALIYYTDYMGRPITDLNDQTFTKWNNSDIPNDGPTAARSYLPTTEDWPNAHLYKTMRYPGGKSNKVGPIDELDYSGYSARMLSKKEVTDSGCVFNYNIKQKRQYFNFNHSCDFLGENIRYNNSGKQPAERGYWLDNHGGYCKGTEGCDDPRPYAWNLIMNNRQSYGLNGEFWDGLHIQMRETYYERGVRPVIDVPRNQIEDNPAENIMHTITYPEGTVQDVIHGGTFMFGNVNTTSTVIENSATVTFKYQDGETADTTSAVKKTKTPTAYKIGNTRYDPGSMLLVLQDYQLEYIYVDTIQPAKFPSDPTRAGYTFKGWYDSPAGGNKYTSYSDDEDITLYARWEGGSSEGYYTITYPNGDTEQVLAGTEWTFPAADNSTKDDEIFTVTFKYHNELEDTTSNVIAQYTANGWKIGTTHYNDGDVITVNHDITLEYDYVVTTIPAEFPSFNYNSDEYIFEGWFTAVAGGNKVTSYDKPEDITLHAHWSEVNPSQPELYNLGFNTGTKPDEIISIVTFKYHNDSPDTTGNVIKYYVPNGWLVDGERYPNNTNIMKTSKTVIEPCFDDFIKPVSFPTNPTKQGYEFVGWFTSDSNGEQVTVYKGTQDITLHAQYTNNYALLMTGRNFYSKLSSLISSYTYSAPGLTFRKANQNEYDSVSSSLTSNNIISLDDSPNEVYMWLSGTDILYYSTADVIYMNSNSSRMFDGANKIGAIDLSGFNSSKVTDMWKMFNNCTRLTSLNLGNFDTSNVKDMSYMFYSCRVLTSLGLSNFNTSKVTNMSYMFYGCEKITSLDLSNFDTSKVTNMSYMFYNCKVLASLDVSNFDTSNVTNLSYMFYNCQILTNIDVSSFDTSEVTTMDSMFYACKKLASLDLSSFNTSKVTDMTAMFYDCESLTSLDVSHFDTSKVTDMDLMFTSCLKVPTLDLSSFDTSMVSKMGSMFFNCFELETIYVSERWNVDAVTTSTNMFASTTKIVGQKGTTYDRDHLDKAYAIIDDAPEHPGYLTYKAALPPAPAAYTITYPDGYIEIVYEGTEWIFPDLPESKSTTVTFDYNYEGTTPYVTEFHKGNIYNAWLIDVENGNSYNAGDTYIVNSDIVLSYDIEENTGSVEFPEDPTREDYEFKGWYDTNAAAGGNKYTEYAGEEDITLYARWKKNSSVNILCKKATTLHTIDCDNTNSYCNANNVSSITYGNLGSGETLQTGDAFDCDVNGDGIFDDEYERFYYVSDYYNTHDRAFNSDYAALVSAYNYIDGPTTGGHNYNLDGLNVDGPSSRVYLPSISDWSNTSLLESNRVIHIKTDSYHPDAYPEFDYEGRAARLLTFEEVRNGCGVAVSTPGYLDNCLFLLENTTFGKDEQDISGSIMTDLDKYSSVYLENNNVEYSDTYVYALDSDTRAVNTMMVSSWYGGIRPTIDVPKSRIGEDMYIITYPDGTTEEVPAGTEFVFPTNSSTKEKRQNATVTFKYNDGSTPDYISYVDTSYTPSGWKIGNDHYNDGDIYIVNSDITLAYDYVEIQSGAEFPSNPTRSGYTFKGWFDSLAGGDKYTSYEENKDITLYARWERNECTNPEEYTLGTNDIAKADEVIGTVTFKYHNGNADTTSNVVKHYTPNGWLVDGEFYKDGETITRCDSTVIEPYYIENIVSAIFPSIPEKDNLKFTGWFTEEVGGTSVAVLNKAGDTIVHAQYTDDYAIFAHGDDHHGELLYILRNYNKNDIVYRQGTREEYLSAVNSGKSISDVSFAGTSVIPKSPKPIYLWLSGNEVLFYSEASVIYAFTDTLWMFGENTKLKEVNLTGINFALTEKTQAMFDGDSNLTKITFGDDFVTYNVIDMSWMFDGCSSLTNLDLSHFDTSKVGTGDDMDFYGMFSQCNSLTELDLSTFNTSNATNMGKMFYECKSLTELDLSSFDTSNVTNMEDMFRTGYKLKTIYVSNKWDNSNVTSSNKMFASTTKIVGQKGTTYDENHVDASYAIIDNAPENPGYLTLKGATKTTKYTITYPDESTEIVDAGTEFKFPSNVPSKDSENVAEVTFKPENDTEDIVKYVTKSFTLPGWKIEDTHYDIGDIYVVNSDITLVYDYVETINGVEFPADPTLDDDVFLGWFNNRKGGTQYTSYSGEEDIVLFAHWQNGGIPSDTLCKKASTLHTQIEGRTTVTYGQLETNGILETGDAFDCDVNGDGIYDSETERFYYISDYYDTNSKSFDNSYATLVYYTQTKAGEIYDKSLLSYYHMNGTPYNNEGNDGNGSTHPTHYSGPAAVSSELPTTSQWSNVRLKTTNRKILDDQGNTTTEYDDETRVLDSYNYSGKAARLLTLDEVRSGCNNVSIDDNMCDIDCTVYVDSSCSFLTEQVPNSGTRNLGATKLETRFHNFYSDFFIISASQSDPEEIFVWMDVTSSEFTSMVRPTIDVPKDKIDLRVVQKYSIYIDNEKVDEIEKNKSYTVPNNTKAKESEEGATVTFKPNNGEEDIIRKVTKTYTPNGYMLDNKLYQEGDKIVVTSDINLTSNYTETNAVEFPADPVKTDYTFEGWFDSRSHGTKYTSYNGENDLTLYAQYSTDKPEPGSLYNLGVNNTPKADTTSVVTFKYQDGTTADTTTTIVKQYVPNGWTVNGTPYPDNATVTYEEGMVIEPAYVETIVSGTWPTDPTWTNYSFQGWFDSVAGGNKYTINEIKETITLYAHWYFDGHDTVLCRRRNDPYNPYTEGILATGDEFDCDVDGDGVYEGTFYYVSDYYDTHTNTFNNEYAAMIYSSNIDGDQPVSPDYGHDALCYATASGWNCGAVSNGPTEVIGDLPTISQWSNTSLYQVNRNILTVDGSLVVENFSYNGYAARLLTVQEINEGCGLGITSDDYDKYTYAGGCGFLSDHLQDYVGPTDSVEITYYLENPIDGQLSSDKPLMVNQNSITDDPDMGAGARPVIDVPKDRIFENVKPANTYTVTYADGHKETVPAGTDITIPENNTTKPNANGAKVTFKPENGGSDIIRYVTKKTVGNGYTINNTQYDSGSTYTVNSDITLKYAYKEVYVNVVYPNDIIKAGYELDDWYTEAEGQGTKVSSYNGTDDKTLYANWTKKTSGEYTLPENTIGKDPEDVATVTFVYKNGKANTTSKVVATYAPNGWLVDGVHKDADEVIDMNPDTVLEPDYIRTVSPATFPANPTKTNYTFMGWVDVEDYNSTNDYTYYTSYDGGEDLTLYAKWETDANHCSITYSDGEIKVVTCGTSVTVPSTINTDSETITFNYMTYWYDEMMDYTETYETSFNRTFYTKASIENYKIGNTTYNPGESFTVDDDIYVERTLGNSTYDDEPFEEPDEAYNFVAWFTDWNNGVQVKSYYDYKSKGLTGELYGHYTDHGYSYEVTVDGSKVGTYDDGYSYTAPAGSDINVDLATVTLINGETTNTYKVHRTGSFSNYKVEKNYGSGLEDEGTVDAGNTVTINAHTFLTSQYDPDTITGVELPVLEDTNTMTFKGWYKNENGSGPKYSGTYTDAIDITLYAVFEGKSANVTYYSDRTESASVLAQGTYKYGDTVNTSNITAGETFTGNGKVHLVYQNGTTANDEYIPLEVTKEIDHWLDNDENSYNKIYTVDFVGSRVFTPVFGNGNVTTYVLPTPASDTYPGYSFAGWYTEPQGGSRVTKVTEDRDVTVYAHWTRNTDPICVYTDGHTEVCNPGDTLTVPSNYTKTISKVYEVANGIDTYRDYIYNTISIEKNYIVDYYVIDGTKYYPGDTYTIESNTTNIETHYDEGTIHPVSLDEYIDDYEIDEWFNNDGVERLFTGWYTERAGGNFVTKYAGEEDLFVYGHYEEDIPSNQFYEVTFIDLSGNYTYYSMLKGTPITLEPEELREGGSFYLDPANGDDIIVEHLYAFATLSDIDVNGDLYHPGDTVIVNSDLTITAIMPEIELTYSPEITNPVKEGYVFTGWYNNDDRIDIDSLDFNNASQLIGTTLVAHYEEYNPQTDVIVDFDGEIRVVPKGTTENLPTSGSKTNDTFTITLNSLRGETDSAIVSREYTLTGFTVNAELHSVGSEVTYIVDTTIRSQYDISYDYASNYPVEYPDLPDISSIYSDFIGWYDAVTGGNEYEDASEITDTITLYARYTPKYNLTVDGVTTRVPEGYVYTVPEGTITGDYITFDLDYDYDDIIKTVKVGRGKGVKYQTINGVRYDANATYTVYSDTTVVTVNNSSNMVVMDPYIETPTRDGYVFIEWRYNGDRVNIYSITPDDVYFDGATLEARWDEFDPETQVYVRCIDKFLNIETTDVLPKGTTRTLQNIPANDSFNATISNNLDDTVINATFTTVAPVSYLTLNGEVHYPGEQYTYNENTVGEVFRDVTTTTECDGGECPSILYQKPNTEVNGYLFKGLFSTQNLDKPVDFSKIYAKYGTNMNDFYSEMILMYQSIDDSIILTVDDEVSIIPKGMGTIPEAKTKASDIYKVTYDYNDGTSRKVYDNIVARYTFDHYNVVGKGEYEAGAAYNYLENTTMNSVFTRSVEFPEIKTIKTENFIGWFTEPHGGVEVTTLEGIERDITLYARYNNEHVTIYIDNVANQVLYGEEFTLPAGTSKSDKSITFTLDYNYDNRTEDYTISTSYEFTGYEMDGNNYEAGYTFEATEDKYVTSKYNLTNEFTPEYTEPDREGYIFNGWFNGTEKVNVSELTADNEEIDGKTLTASWTEVTPDDVVVTYDGEQRVVPIGTKLSELGDSPIKPSAETFTVYIDRNNGSFIIDEYEITKTYSLDKVYINGELLEENDYTFNEDTTVTTSYTANYEPNIFEGLTSDISGIFTEPTGGVKVENYDNVNDGDTLYYQYGETHTITVDGEVIATVPHGSEYTLPVNSKAKAMENIAEVTFDYGDGRDLYVTYVRKRFNANGWSISGEPYSNNEKITVNEDIVLDREYYETVQGIDFPRTPKRANYRFDGWYYNDEVITSYDGDEDITINANWIKQIIITYLDDGTTEIVDTGTTMVLDPKEDKEEVFHNITFKYNYEGCPEDKVVRISSHDHFIGWIVNSTDEYDDGDEITFVNNSTVKARYEKVISNKNLPEDPVREGYDFLGWYDGMNIENSNKVDITKIAKTMTVYGQYKVSGEHVVYFDGRTYTYTDATSVDTESAGFMSDTKEEVITLTLDYQNKSIENESIDYTIVSTFVNWTDENGETYGKVIDLTNVPDGMHFTSNYDTEDFTPVDLSEYDPEVNDFEGWFTEKTEGIQVTTYDGEGSVTYYAHYGEIKQVIITIDNEVTIYSVGETFNLPAANTKADDAIVITFDPQNGEESFTRSIVTSYTFTGYRLDTDNELYAGETEFTANEDMTFTSEYTSSTVGAEWPEDPEKDNYEFLGWYTDQTTGIEVFNFDGITSNTSLYAHYTTDDESFVTLTNTVTGESLKVQKSTDWVFGDSKFNKDNKEKLGTITYKFNSAGYPDEEIDYYRNSTITGYYIEGDDTLYNIDEDHQFTSDTNITPYYGNVVTDSHVGIDQFDYEVTNGNKQARCFSKTNQDPEDTHDDGTYTCYENYDENDGNVTVYLHWRELKKITVTEPDGTTTEYDEGDTYNTGVNDSTKDPEGYTVTFKYQDGREDTTQSHMTTYTANGWLINGEHVNDNTDITLEEDLVKEYDYTETSTTITLPEPTRDDYTFVGWNSRANGKGTTYDNDSINALDKDTTVYAIWTKEEINITFIENGGSDVDDMTIGYDTPIGDLPTTSKENERITEGDNNIIIGYIFDGWYRDPEFTSKVSSTTTFTDDATLYAKFIVDEFPYVYPYHEDSFVCTGSNYIDTGIKLFTSNNDDYLKDFEVGFTIESYVPNQQSGKQVTFFNAKWENTAEQWPGVAFRRKDSTANLELSSSAKKNRVAYDVPNYTLPLEVRIYRIDNEIYLSTDGGATKAAVQSVDGFTQYFDINSYFCAGDNGNGGIQRYVKGTISNYYIKLGDYQGTVDDVTTHTVTYPDNSVETYYHNTIIELDANEEAKADEIGAAVTFDYNDGVTPSEIRYNTKTFTPNGFIVNDDTHYDDNSTLVVDEDKVITYDYISETDDVTFPDDPTREYYTFDGWFTEGGDKVEYYDGTEDITLYAHWTRETVNIIYPDETITVDKGEAYTLRTNDITKADDNAATVTFKYHDGETEDLVRYVKYHYTANGWSIDGTAYADGAAITPVTDTTVTPEYTSENVEVEFPEEPTREHYEFDGWYDSETGGNKVETYNGVYNITLHAHWIGEELTVITPNDTYYVKYGEEFTVEDDIEKDSETLANVTFYFNDEDDNTDHSEVIKEFTQTGWEDQNGHSYTSGQVIIVYEDMELTPVYEEEIIGAIFPDDPTRDHYEFLGWFDNEYDGTEITSYEGEEDINIYAYWLGEELTVTTPRGITYLHYGDEYQIEGYIDKDPDIIGTITFHNGDDIDERHIYREYEQTDWVGLAGDTHAAGEWIYITYNEVYTPVYYEETTTDDWPDDPEKDNYTFVGWFTEDDEQVSEFPDEGDLDLYAHWNMTLPTDFDIDVDNITMMVGETHQIEVTFTPDGTSDTVTYADYDGEKISVADGLVTALAKGETTITVGLENVPDKTKEITVTVISDRLESDVYDVREEDIDLSKDRVIVGAEPLTTIGEFKDNLLNPTEYVKIYDSEGNELEDDEDIRTGLVIKLEYNGIVADEAILVLRGDVDGDGVVNLVDYMAVINHYVESAEITEYPFFLAADVDEDETINMADAMKILNYYTENIDTLND